MATQIIFLCTYLTAEICCRMADLQEIKASLPLEDQVAIDQVCLLH